MESARLISFVDLIVKLTMCPFVYVFMRNICTYVTFSLQIPTENHVIQAVRQSGCHDNFHLHLCVGINSLFMRHTSVSASSNGQWHQSISNEVIKGDLFNSFVLFTHTQSPYSYTSIVRWYRDGFLACLLVDLYPPNCFSVDPNRQHDYSYTFNRTQNKHRRRRQSTTQQTEKSVHDFGCKICASLLY